MATSRLTNADRPGGGHDPAAIVLVGGRSSRMGTDKASLVVDGLAMRDRVLQVVAEAGIKRVVVAGTIDVPDAVSADGESGSQGPLAGIVGAWNMLRSTAQPPCGPIAVLACDLPWLRSDVVRQLVAVADEHTHGAVAHDGERAQPLVAAYQPVALDETVVCFEAGERSLRRCSASWDLGVVLADARVVSDADTPDDLAGFVVEWPL